MRPGHQRATSAPSRAAALSNGQPSDVKALTSKVDKLASTVKLLADESSLGGKVRDRSRSPTGAKKKAPRGNGGKGKAKGGGAKGKGSRFEDLMKQHRDRFVLKRDGQEICYKFQDEKITDQGCVRAHVCVQVAVATVRGNSAGA